MLKNYKKPLVFEITKIKRNTINGNIDILSKNNNIYNTNARLPWTKQVKFQINNI